MSAEVEGMQPPLLPSNEPRRLAGLRALDLLDTPADERFDRITRIARALFKVPIALISLVDENRQWFKSRQGLTVCETSRDISFCGHAILENKVLWVEDARHDPRFHDNPLVTGQLGLRFYAGYPIRTTDGNCIGTLCIIDTSPRPFSAEHLSLLSDLGRLAARELESSPADAVRVELAGKTPAERKQFIDTVTGVWNREGMLEIMRVSLAECAGKKQPATILLVELDIIAKMSEQFDAAGHDKIVAEIAQVLRSSIQSHDTIGRTRGEQFAVLLRGLSIQSAAARVAEIKKNLDANPVLEAIGVRLHVGHTCTIPETATPDVEAELEAARNSLARARRVKAATRG